MVSQKIGVIGCGSIGKILSEAVISGKAGDSELKSLFDVDREKAEKLKDDLNGNPRVNTNFDQFLDDDLDIVVEAASQKAVKEYSEKILKSGKDLIVLSSGAFSDEGFLEKVENTARKLGKNVYVPSGAILGLDGVHAANIAGLEKAIVKTRKPPETLEKTKYARKRGLDLSELEKPKQIFEGSANEAVDAFPGSVNVAASLSLAGRGMDKTKVQIVADPSLSQNKHKVEVEGEAGSFTAEAVNFPSPKNPKTSYLAALSAIQMLKKLKEPIKIGT